MAGNKNRERLGDKGWGLIHQAMAKGRAIKESLSLTHRIMREGAKNMAYYDRVVLPFLLVGQSFKLRQYDRETAIGMRGVDVYAFTNRQLTQLYKGLSLEAKIHHIKHPASAMVPEFHDEADSKNLLVCVSNIVNEDTAPQELLDILVRDTKIVVEKAIIKNVDLRFHPLDQGAWKQQLQTELAKEGISSRIIGNEKPIWSLAWEYKGLLCGLSSVMSEFKSTAKHGFVVVSLGASKYWGESEAGSADQGFPVRFIREDGQHDPDLITIDSGSETAEKDLIQVLLSCAKKAKK